MNSHLNKGIDDWLTASLDWLVKGLIRLAHAPRPFRQLLALSLDLLLCVAACWFALSLRLGIWLQFTRELLIVIAVFTVAWLAASWLSEVYRSIIRLSGNRTMADLAGACVLMMVPALVIFTAVGVTGVPRTIALIQPMVFLILLVVSRLLIRYLVQLTLGYGIGERRRRVMIYGAGLAGRQLAHALKDESKTVLVGYLDRDRRLIGQRVDGARVHSAEIVAELTKSLAIDDIYLALPSASRSERKEIVASLEGLGVRVRSLPTLGQLADGTVSVSDLREVPLDDLLGREVVSPDEVLLGQAITGRTVVVTGAGGSIGSELCRQILLREPRRLILVENSEFALYQIDAELRADALPGIEIVPELADVADANTADRMFRRFRADTVFHAAAYKHVPLIENNPIAGLRNNVIGTLNCCLAAEKTGVGRFILVSSDKAVHPTNVMGASKRISELILQARADLGSPTIFSMVRFGNVLGSSGSVVPRFRDQIANGGPVTVTDRNVTRYFMTIPEAAQLVMQGGAMAEGGEVFVLDMKEPIKIIDLARKMILLSGLRVKEGPSGEGDIEIVEIGMRPGEKMYEELLLGADTAPTRHQSIIQAFEARLPWDRLAARLAELAVTFRDGDSVRAVEIMRILVPEYRTTAETDGCQETRRDQASADMEFAGMSRKYEVDRIASRLTRNAD
ncbi:MAG: polysaccharide biosynthesis protein [Qipengyuania sp.]|nr:polysaccharide biosynthesis protein [Qipengyuania sp.]